MFNRYEILKNTIGNKMKYKDLYTIQSKITKKFLTNPSKFFHNDIFEADSINNNCCFWNNRLEAERIAKLKNGILHICKFCNGHFLYSAKILIR